MTQQWDWTTDKSEVDRTQRQLEILVEENNETQDFLEVKVLQAKLREFAEKGLYPNPPDNWLSK